ERDVEREVDLLLRCRRDQTTEAGQRAQLLVDRLVAALFRAYRPGAAGLSGPRRLLVGALAVGPADGVDGRQVEDVETEAGDSRQETLDIFERPGFASFSGAPGKELVPRA